MKNASPEQLQELAQAELRGQIAAQEAEKAKIEVQILLKKLSLDCGALPGMSMNLETGEWFMSRPAPAAVQVPTNGHVSGDAPPTG